MADATKRCGKCERELPASEFHRAKRARDGLQGRCKSCNKRLRDAKKDAEYRATYHEKNPELRGEWHRRWREKLKQDVLEAYGRKCECCGEDREDFLTIDHVGGRNEEHRDLKTQQVYVRLRREGFPKDGYRLLCWNCNCAIGIHGSCPHERERNMTLRAVV